jgi:hypothetical protein
MRKSRAEEEIDKGAEDDERTNKTSRDKQPRKENAKS